MSGLHHPSCLWVPLSCLGLPGCWVGLRDARVRGLLHVAGPDVGAAAVALESGVGRHSPGRR